MNILKIVHIIKINNFVLLAIQKNETRKKFSSRFFIVIVSL